MLAAIETSLQEAIQTETPGKTPGKTSGKTSDRILALLAETPTRSIPELAAQLVRSERAVERAIRTLRDAGHLARIGPAKGGRWQVLP
jgi:predicted HTH transcriptional regulator